MDVLFFNSLSDFADEWTMDQPAEEYAAVDRSLTGGVTIPACDIAGAEIMVAAEVFGDGDKAAEEVAVADGELKAVKVLEEAVLKRKRRTERKMVEKSAVAISPSEVLQRRSTGRKRCAARAGVSVSPPLGTVNGRLTAYTLNVNTGEDVISRILSFSKFGCQAICTILSATGIVSRVTICQPGHPYELANFEGCFEIISLSGSMAAGKIIGRPEDGGMLNILLADSDGEVFGGVVGSLIAAAPIQLVCGGLAERTNRKPKRRHCTESSVAAGMSGNWKAKKVATTMTRPSEKENFKTWASAVSELTNGAGDATFPGQSMILTSLNGVNEKNSQS